MTPSSLREKLESSSRFLIGTELVSVRGGMQERSAVKARQFATQLVECPDIDWISITDNAGGNPQLAPSALGKPILYAGKEVVIHLTCKDHNRNGLESEAWLLHSEGFHNILAMTGDYPIAGSGGAAKPVFDIDSVGLIALLKQMNEGLDQRFGRTRFLTGAVTTNFKLREGEVVPQYHKLAAKVRSGAEFIINQIGFDARKMHELHAYMAANGMGGVPLIGNVYLLNGRVADVFHQGRIPGVVVTAPLRERCVEMARSPDRGAAFFQEFAAKQIALYRGLGCRGAYVGGVHDFITISKILEIERTFSKDDWRSFVSEFSYSRPDEFYYYGQDEATGLADPTLPGGPYTHPRANLSYELSKRVHASLFTAGKPLARWGKSACAASADPAQGPGILRALEHASKAVMFRCRDCGDCSLPEIAYLCPESQCAKNQRNGPCGGTREGRCEVDGFGDCIWLRAYDRLKADGATESMLAHAPVVQNQALRGTSSWANSWLGKDHTDRRASKPVPTP